MLSLFALGGNYSPYTNHFSSSYGTSLLNGSTQESQPKTCQVYIPRENCIFSGGDGWGQYVYAEYTENSTQEDPIVRIHGTSLRGEYDMMVHVNDINPNNASYAEMCALIGHLKETGEYSSASNTTGLLSPVPLDVVRGDYTAPKNYMNLIQNSVSHNQKCGNYGMSNSGSKLLALFKDFMEQKANVSERGVDSLRSYLEHNLTISSIFSNHFVG